MPADDYQAKLRAEADAQGIAAIVVAIAAHGLPVAVAQTSGWCLVAITVLPDETTIGLTRDDDGDVLSIEYTPDQWAGQAAVADDAARHHRTVEDAAPWVAQRWTSPEPDEESPPAYGCYPPDPFDRHGQACDLYDGPRE
ncbi:hypothetical protein [Cellulomonas sp. Y8]|uniref:hypothetical protein n=1 Tax=Cellulomonas sp. Y8 TaxID=2591145 RepID=UPI0011C96F3A|nr:hypothetical protein [Cellulomonas sp. Y8]